MTTRQKMRLILLSISIATLAVPFAASADSLNVSPDQIVKDLPAPLPVEIRPFSTGAEDPHEPLKAVKSPTQLNCIKKQLGELQKVADAAGGNDALMAPMKRYNVVFEILNNDTTSGHPSRLTPGLSRGIEPHKLILLITNLVSVDPKTQLVRCENVAAEKIVDWLKHDVNHLIHFPADSLNPRGSSRAIR